MYEEFAKMIAVLEEKIWHLQEQQNKLIERVEKLEKEKED